jgi:hypothetical protein
MPGMRSKTLWAMRMKSTLDHERSDNGLYQENTRDGDEPFLQVRRPAFGRHLRRQISDYWIETTDAIE